MKKLEGHIPGPLYAAPIRGAVLGFPELLKFLVAHRERGWVGATLTEADAELYASAPTLLEQRDKLVKALRGALAETTDNSFIGGPSVIHGRKCVEVTSDYYAGRKCNCWRAEAERVLREVGE